jgi:hypothetical protein
MVDASADDFSEASFSSTAGHQTLSTSDDASRVPIRQQLRVERFPELVVESDVDGGIHYEPYDLQNPLSPQTSIKVVPSTTETDNASAASNTSISTIGTTAMMIATAAKTEGNDLSSHSITASTQDTTIVSSPTTNSCKCVLYSSLQITVDPCRT